MDEKLTGKEQQFRDTVAFFKAMQDRLTLKDVTKTDTINQQTYKKDTLRTYMKAPNRYAKELRQLSRYLRERSQIYKKIINDNATMIDTNFRNIIPDVDPTKKGSKSNKQMMKSFVDTCRFVDTMNLPSEMLKVYLECWTVDAYFGVYYYYKDQGGVLLQLDPDYCQITGVYPTGDFAFSFDCSYFQGSNEYKVELWGEPFISMYRAFQADTTNGKWQPVPDEYACCLKVNLDDYRYTIPPYLTLFNSIINVEDLKEIMAVADEQQIYKLISFYLPTFENSKAVDDFKLNPLTAMEYFDAVKDTLPNYVNSIITPMPIEAVNFSDDQASDVNKVENASKNILKTSGHTVLADPTGTTAVMAALKSDEDYAISSLLAQTQSWVNRMVSYYVSKPAKVKFLEVTKYTRTEFKNSLIQDMNYGLPVINTLGALDGFSELDLISMASVNDAFGLAEVYKPLQTAATRSREDTKQTSNRKQTDEAEESADNADRYG